MEGQNIKYPKEFIDTLIGSSNMVVTGSGDVYHNLPLWFKVTVDPVVLGVFSEEALPKEAKTGADNMNALLNRSDNIKLLEKFGVFLEKQGYMDTDWRAEEPFAIDEFLKEDE